MALISATRSSDGSTVYFNPDFITAIVPYEGSDGISNSVIYTPRGNFNVEELPDDLATACGQAPSSTTTVPVAQNQPVKFSPTPPVTSILNQATPIQGLEETEQPNVAS